VPLASLGVDLRRCCAAVEVHHRLSRDTNLRSTSSKFNTELRAAATLATGPRVTSQRRSGKMRPCRAASGCL
jgi:hypothetical protein